jgi:TP901 family phage tail tape measure protein
MATATQVVARFTADISDVQSKMSAARGAFASVGEAATWSSQRIAAVGQSMADVGKKMTVGITLPLGGIAVAASNAAMSFETNMTKITALVGIASDEVARMGDEILNTASSLGKSPDELAQGLFVVTSAGLRGAEAMATLNNAARAGAAGLGETNDIARAVSGALSAYGSDVLSASEATDAIVATARAGNFETSQFAAAIGRVLPFAQQAGASFQDMGGAVALLTRVNGDAAQSVTQMQALFRAFVVPTEEAKKALEEVGLSAQDLRASIAEKGLPATLEMLDKALGGNREQLGRLLGSSEAASAAFQILEADAAAIEETFGVVAGSAGMTAEAFGIMSQTTQFQVSAAMAELKATLIDLGQQFLPIIKSVMDFMQANLNAFNSLPGPIKQFILVMGGILAALGPILFIGGKLIVMFAGLLSIMMKMRAVGALRLAFAQLRGEMAMTRASMKQTQTSMGMMGTAANLAKTTVVASFRAIGTAAKGLLASMGPIGLAMVAIGAAFEIFVGQAAGAQHHISNLRDEINLLTGEMTEAGKVFVATELRHNLSPEDLAMLDSYGLGISDLMVAMEQGGPALDAYRQRMADMRLEAEGMGGLFDTGFGNVGTITSMDTIIGTLNGMIGYYDQAKLAAEDVAKAQVDGAVAASDAVRGMAGEYRAAAAEQRAIANGTASDGLLLQNVIDKTADAVRGLKTAFSDLNDIVSDIRAADAAKDAYAALLAGIEENGDGFRRTTEEQRANRDNLLDYIDAQVAYAESLEKPQEQLAALQQLEKDTKAALKKGGVKAKDSALYQSVEDAVTEAEKKVGDMKTAVDNAKDEGLKVADAIALGIEAGMTQQQSTLNAAGGAAGDFTVEGLHAALDMNSPSGVAMDAGRNTGVGLIMGLNQMRSAASGAGMNVGANVVRGMITALNNGVGPVAAAARALVAAAIAAARDESQEGSPSKVFIGIGDNMVKGLRIGVARSTPEGAKEMSKAAKIFIAAFMDSFQPKDFGPAASAVVDAIQRIKQEAEDDKELKAWLEVNKKAIGKLKELAAQFDYITAKMEGVKSAFAALSDLLRTPLGTQSDLSRMFEFGQSPESLARNFTDIAALIRESFAVLIDPEIVGKRAARINRLRMKDTIKELRGYVKEMMALQAEYDANLEQMRENEEQWRIDERALSEKLAAATKAYEDANRELDRIVGERDSLIKSITDGFRSFVNNLSDLSKEVVSETTQTTQELANGVRFIVQQSVSETASGAAAIGKRLQDRLNEVKEFSKNIQSLMERGLDPTLVRDFIQAGVSGAGETVAILAAATDDELKGINETQAELLKYAQEFATGVGDAYYGAAISAQQAIVNDLKAEVDAAQKALDDARTAFNTEQKRLEDENTRLEGQITGLAARIEALITQLMATLPAETTAAAQASIDAMIAEFKRKFPELKSEFGKLMDKLAKSMERTVTITVRTVQEGTGGATGRSAATAFTPGTVRLATAPTARSVTVAPNAVSVNVNAGAGVDRAALVSQVKAAVDESLESLAREIVAA